MSLGPKVANWALLRIDWKCEIFSVFIRRGVTMMFAMVLCMKKLREETTI